MIELLFGYTILKIVKNKNMLDKLLILGLLISTILAHLRINAIQDEIKKQKGSEPPDMPTVPYSHPDHSKLWKQYEEDMYNHLKPNQ